MLVNQKISADDERLRTTTKVFAKGWDENTITAPIYQGILCESLKINKVPNNWNIIVDKIKN